MNIQYAIANDTVYVLEANPRASRTVPLVSKVCNIPMARIATQLMLGKKLADLDLKPKNHPPLRRQRGGFPLQHVPGGGPAPGPGDALHRRSPGNGRLLRAGLLQGPGGGPADTALGRHRADHRIGERTGRPSWRWPGSSTDWGSRSGPPNGTHAFLTENGIESEPILKMHEGRPNIVDAIKNNEIQLVINTPSGKLSKHDDSYIRKAAIKYKIPYITTLAAALPPPGASRRFAKAPLRSSPSRTTMRTSNRRRTKQAGRQAAPWSDCITWPLSYRTPGRLHGPRRICPPAAGCRRSGRSC